MPRQARLDYPGSLNHVIIRGFERRKIFLDDSDKDDFLQRLSHLMPSTQMACYAWCLLPNQIHLLMKSGGLGLSYLMRRLLTGYVVSFNKKHNRSGPLFQNRFKSVLCQEDLYLTELVRYIHLKPLTDKLVNSLPNLAKYEYCGHGALLGESDVQWQDTRYILSRFAKKAGDAQKEYLAFVKEGHQSGQTRELTGGGLIRSAGGWTELKKLRKSGAEKAKGDERILGDYKFVSMVLSKAREPVDEAYELKTRGVDYADVEKQASRKFGLKKADLYSKSRKKHIVMARSVFMYWACRKLGYSCTELAKRFKITQPAVSYAVERGEQIVEERKLRLII